MTRVAKNVKRSFGVLTGRQIRAARALIRWSAEELSRECAVSLRTIQRAELVDGKTSMTPANDLAVRRALESAGVEFLDGNGDGVGVIFRRRKQAKLRGELRPKEQKGEG
jgi:hypothetical protein